MDDPARDLLQMGVPLVLMVILTFAVPYLLVPRATRSHTVLTLCIMGAAVLLVILGGVITNLFDDRSHDTLGGLASLYALWLYLRESLYFAILWVPLLGYVWLLLAQRVERLRGEDMMRKDMNT